MSTGPRSTRCCRAWRRPFAGPSFWRPFVRDAHAAGIPRLQSWLEGAGRVVEDQFRRRGLRHLRPADMPLSTSPMDGLIEPIRAALHPRRYGLKNRERTNRLLLLMQPHANRRADVLAYTKDIRAWLEANHGRPRVPPPPCHQPTQQPLAALIYLRVPVGSEGESAYLARPQI